MSLYMISVSRSHPNNKNRQIPVWLLILLIGILIGLFFVSSLPLTLMPKSLLIKDEAKYPTRFIGENAYNHIKFLSTNISTRFTGSDNNEILTVEYLVKTATDIKNKMDPSLDLEIQVQKGSGSFHELWQQYSSINVYENVQNVIVKLSNRKINNNNWILINSHFDAVPMSPGAGDDGTMVGIMLEMLRVLAKNVTLNHTVVFLFNGCEENSLQGAHSFITNYEDIDKIKLLINLDVAGPGGRELLFQTSKKHPWLMNAYFKAVPNPFATVIGEEMYQNGFIPSDTDFSMFSKEIGDNLPAYDMAQIRNGYVYHSKHDGIANIDMGSLQSTGDNMIALLKELDTRPELDSIESESHTKYVFYDFFGLFLIFYTQTVGIAINCCVAGLIILIAFISIYRFKVYEELTYKIIFVEYLKAITIQLLGIGLGIAFVFFMAWLLDTLNRPMTWYSNTWLLFGIYFLEIFLIFAMTSSAYVKFRKNKYISKYFVVQLQLNAYSTILAIILLVITLMNIRSAFIMMISLVFYIISTTINMIFKLDTRNNKWIYAHIIGQIIPILYYFYMFDMFLSTLIPTSGRNYSSGDQNPEYMIGIVTALFVVLTLQFIAPTLTLFKYGNYCIAFLQLVFCTCIVILFTPLSFPYKEATAPQRFHIWHTQIRNYDYNQKLYKTDNGFYVLPHDRNGIKYIKDSVPLIKDTSPDTYDMTNKCKEQILCGIPHYHVYYTGNVYNGIWLPAVEPPKFKELPELNVIAKKTLSDRRSHYYFMISGPSHMSLHISPLPGVKLVGWSFLPEINENHQFKWNERDVYFINYVRGLEPQYSYEFSLEFELPEDDDWTSEYKFDIALAAQFVHQPSTHTNEFLNFVGTFPTWTTLQYFTNYYVSYQY
uniref:FXNA-like protease n=1 Tax=Culicoides sonorensis TaxID=179676 RepID=A0A336M4B8_CULSO